MLLSALGPRFRDLTALYKPYGVTPYLSTLNALRAVPEWSAADSPVWHQPHRSAFSILFEKDGETIGTYAAIAQELGTLSLLEFAEAGGVYEGGDMRISGPARDAMAGITGTTVFSGGIWRPDRLKGLDWPRFYVSTTVIVGRAVAAHLWDAETF